MNNQTNATNLADNWRTLILPLAQQLDTGDEIKDINGQAVLKVLSTSKNEERMGSTNAKISFVGPGSDNGAVAHAERKAGCFRDKFEFTKFAICNDRVLQSQHAIHGRVVQGPFGKNLSYNKENNGHYQPVLTSKGNAALPLSLLFCFLPSLCCKKHVFKFYSAASPKQLVMVRNQQEKTLEIGPDISVEEAVSVAYAIDWMTLPCDDRIFRSNLLWGIL